MLRFDAAEFDLRAAAHWDLGFVKSSANRHRYSDMVDRHHALPSVPSPAALLMGAASHGSHHRVGG